MEQDNAKIIQECRGTLGNIRVPAVLTTEISVPILAVMQRLSEVEANMTKKPETEENKGEQKK